MGIWMKWIGVATVLTGLTACATGPRTVDASVRTVAAPAPGAAVLQNARYRFERGPLVAGQPDPAKLEAMAQTALARVGLQRDDAGAQLSVQVGGYVNAYWRDEWGRPMGYGYGPRMSLGLGFGGGWRGGGIGLGMGWPIGDPDIPAYVSEVNLLMRDLRTGQIVYDTRARHDGPWHDTDNVLVALFVAALEGYPSPAQSVRQVGVPLLPPASAAAGSAPPLSTTGGAPQAAPAPTAPAPAPGAPVMVTPRH